MKKDNIDIKRFKNIYFIGIGGIGMSALALYFKSRGYNVFGYDRVPSIITGMLEAKNIPVHFEELPEELIKLNVNDTLVVYTPAIPKEHKELLLAVKLKYKILKRAEVLGLIAKFYKTIAIGGTHGKTTVTSMVAHIFKIARKKSIVFTGGLMNNYGTNFFDNENAEYLIVEADEYDRSFLNFDKTFVSVVTAVDSDHLDIYGNYENLKNAFIEFSNSLVDEGILIVNEKYANLFDRELVKYGIDFGKYRAVNLSVKDFKFDLEVNGKIVLSDIKLKVAGRHNIENAVCAAAIAMECGIKEKHVKKALESFLGNWRRFEIVFDNGEVIYIDDYAHHPKEIEVILESVRSIWENKKVTVVFQPHLYSRTKDLGDDFAKALSLADEVILLPIYPARELPMPGISSEWLAMKIAADVVVIEKERISDFLRNKQLEVLITLGAGDIDREVKRIKEMLYEKNRK